MKMLEAIEIINNVIAQHQKITEVVKTTGNNMNDIDAVFSVQNSTWQVAWMTTTLPKLLERRGSLSNTINILADGLKKHFEYEQKALPLVLGEQLMKDILHDHDRVLAQIETTRTFLTGLDDLKPDDFHSKRLDLIKDIDSLRDLVLNHAHYEEIILLSIKKVFEDNLSTRSKLKLV
jgi:hypothetical protein